MNSKIYPLLQFLLISIVASYYGVAFAANAFNIEEPLEHQTTIPASILSELGKKVNLKQNGCTENKIHETLEATKIDLTPSLNHILVKPKAFCICGANYCPVWIYQVSKKTEKLI